MKLITSKFSKKIGVTLFLFLVTLLLVYGIVIRYMHPTFYVYHYKKVMVNQDNLKEELCFLPIELKRKWGELNFKKSQLSNRAVFAVLETTLLKPNAALIEKVSPMREVSIRKVRLADDFLIIDFNREFLFLTESDEVKTLNTLLLGIIDNFPKIKEISVIVEGRAVGRLHSKQNYILPINVASFTNLIAQIEQQKIMRRLKSIGQAGKSNDIRNCSVSQP